MDEQLVVRMDGTDAKKLNRLAQQMGVTRSEAIRALIRAAELVPQQKTVYTPTVNPQKVAANV